MNNTIMRMIPVAAGYTPLSATQLVGTFDISCPPANAANVQFKGDDGNDVDWIPGEYHQLIAVDLSQIQVKGGVGDKVSVVGFAGFAHNLRG